nr:unnamed protein product [Digitaria exilis]
MFDEVFSAFRQLSDNSLHLTSFFFPYAPFPSSWRRDKAHAKLKNIFAEIVRSRKSSNRCEEDVLQSLIDSKYKDGRPTTEAEVTGLIMVILFAGKHTSSASSTWTGARLLSHPQCLEAAIKEQQEILKKYKGEIDYNTLLDMSVLHRCIKEALRMHPPAPTFFRKVHKNFTVRTREGHEFEIPRGHTILSPLVINNNIPYIYKDPGVYDPDRFGPGREEDKVKVIWSHLLRNFELQLVSPFPETDWLKIALEPKERVMVRYKRHPPCGLYTEN